MKEYQLAIISSKDKRLSPHQIEYLNQKRLLLSYSGANPVLAEMLETILKAQPTNHL